MLFAVRVTVIGQSLEDVMVYVCVVFWAILPDALSVMVLQFMVVELLPLISQSIPHVGLQINSNVRSTQIGAAAFRNEKDGVKCGLPDVGLAATWRPCDFWVVLSAAGTV